MPRVITFLNDGTIENLQELCNDTDKSLSKIVSELVEIGYKAKKYHELQKSNTQANMKAELADKHIEYLLETMAIAVDIYRCVRNEKSKYKEKDVSDVLATITTNIQNYISGMLKKK